jgi:hypothetical protein
MKFKHLMVCLLMVPLLAFSGPEQQERHQFCTKVAENVVASHQLRLKGMSVEEVSAALMAYAQSLLLSGMPESDVSLLVNAVIRGWDAGEYVQKEAQEAYYGCMGRKSI